MEVLLVQDFPTLGFVGEQLSVKNGYARNYLIPQGIAIEASSRNAKELQHRLAMVNARKAKKKAEAVALMEKLQQEKLEFKLKLGEEGKSFGSVASHDVLAALVAKGYALDRKQISLTEAIRTVGNFDVNVKLHAEVVAKLTVSVVAEKVAEPKKDNGRKPRHQKNVEEAAEEVAVEETTDEE